MLHVQVRLVLFTESLLTIMSMVILRPTFMNTRLNYTDMTPTIHLNSHWEQRALAWHLCLCFWLLIVVSVHPESQTQTDVFSSSSFTQKSEDASEFYCCGVPEDRFNARESGRKCSSCMTAKIINHFPCDFECMWIQFSGYSLYKGSANAVHNLLVTQYTVNQ